MLPTFLTETVDWTVYLSQRSKPAVVMRATITRRSLSSRLRVTTPAFRAVQQACDVRILVDHAFAHFTAWQPGLARTAQDAQALY